MTLHYQHRRTAILLYMQQHDHSLFTCEHKYKTVTEAIGTGLAIQHIYNTGHDLLVYGLLHLQSGTTLTRSTLPGVVAAALWLRRILPLFDCTLPQAAFKYNKEPVIQVKGEIWGSGRSGMYRHWTSYSTSLVSTERMDALERLRHSTH